MLAVYLAVTLWALLIPRRQPDPQAGVAQGCLMLVVSALAALGLLLWVGVAFRLAWLVTAVSCVAVWPVLHAALTAIVGLARRARGE